MLTAGANAIAGANGPQPAIVISMSSIAKQKETIADVMSAAGFSEMNFVVKSQLDLFAHGIDQSKGAGVMIYPGQDGSVDWLAFLPIEDLDELLDLASGFGGVEEDGDEILLELDGDDIHAREVGSYLYMSQNESMFNRIPSSPERVLASMPSDYSFALKVLPSQIPQDLKQTIQDSFTEGMDGASSSEAAESATNYLSSLLNQTEAITLGLAHDSVSDSLLLDIAIKGSPSSNLAQWQRQNSGSQRSKFAGFVMPEETFSFNYSDKPTAQGRQGMIAIVDEFRKIFLEQLEDDVVEVERAASIINQMSKVVKETIASGTVDAAAVLSDESNFAAGMRVVNPRKFEEQFKEFASLEQSADDVEFKLNIGVIKGTNIRVHEALIDVTEEDPELRKLFGTQVKLYVCANDEAVYLAFGPNPLTLLKKGIEQSARSDLVKSPQVNLSAMSALRLSTFFQDDTDRTSTFWEVLEQQGTIETISLKWDTTENGVSYRLEVLDGVIAIIGGSLKGAAGGDF